MKRLTRLTLIVLILLGAVQTKCGAKVYKAWKKPCVLNANLGCLKLKSVVFTDTATIVQFVSENNPKPIHFFPFTFLMNENKETPYFIKGCKEYKLGELMHVENKVVPVTLFFEPMPKETEVFDLYESMLPNAFKMLGVTNKKPYQVKHYAFSEDSIKEVRRNFFHTDTATIRGRIVGWPGYEGKSLTVYHNNAVTCESEPWVILVNKDGSFERKVVIDCPTLEYAHVDDVSVFFPYFLLPGHTLDITYYANGVVQYNDSLGNNLPFGVIGVFSPIHFDDIPSAYEFKDKIDFKHFAAMLDSDMKNKLSILDYVAERMEYGQLDYYLTRLNIMANYASVLLDYAYYKSRNTYDKNIDSLIAVNDSIAQLYDVSNYSLLRKLPVQDELLLSVPNYYMLQNRYQYSPLMRKVQDDCYAKNEYEAVDSAKIEVDKLLLGVSEPSMLMKSSLTNDFIFKLKHDNVDNATMDQVDWDKDFPTQESRETQLKVINKTLKDNFFRKVAMIKHPFFEAKVKDVYEYCHNQSIVQPLPECNAATILRKHIDMYRGKYLFIDFWATSCGPCRYGIKKSEAVRKELRDNEEFDFLFITDEGASPEEDYTKYVAEHLDGEDVVRVSKSEFTMYEEMFKFTGIPHYVIIDPEGRMINEIGGVTADYPNMCSSKEMFEQYFNAIKTACKRK